MKKYLLISALIVVAGLTSFSPADTWQKYSSADGHFSISFPGKPEESADVGKTVDSILFKIHYVTYSPSDDEVYMTGWINMTTFYPKDGNLQTILENSRDGAAASMKATKVTTLKTNLGKMPFIEFTFGSDDFTGKERIYLVNKFQYSVITIFSVKNGIPPAADRFIASFKAL